MFELVKSKPNMFYFMCFFDCDFDLQYKIYIVRFGKKTNSFHFNFFSAGFMRESDDHKCY